MLETMKRHEQHMKDGRINNYADRNKRQKSLRGIREETKDWEFYKSAEEEEKAY